ncbi:PP2C family protein-serine/threonine phosphatase [Streptomyces diastaticus]|uniref:PP2C family protein-serine/threonine phosphatase n=1 Tax=Streptomyces diastaticus TaxID=1956 RepID=UPI00342F8912
MGKRGDAEREMGRPAAEEPSAEGASARRGGNGRTPLGNYKSDRRTASRSRALVRLLPAVLIVAGVIFDEAAPPRFNASPLYAAAPLIAAPFFSLLGTVATGAVALAAVSLLQWQAGTLGEVDSTTELLTILTCGLLAVLSNRVVSRSGEELATARNIAEAAQRAVLPIPAERIGGFDVAARYEAAQADALIGGDLYAVQETPHGVRLLVGDVRGKGLGAVEAVAVVIGAFREAAEQESSLEMVAQRLERALAREGVRREGLDQFEGFTTALLAEIPPGQSVVRTVNRGHPEPLLLDRDGRVRVLVPAQPALPLGMGDLGAWPDRSDTAPFPSGAILLLFTDGLTEARDRRGVFYDPAARLTGRRFGAPDHLLETLSEEVRVHTSGGPQDDMALLALRRP